MTLDEYEESLRRGENAASTATATTATDGGESGSDLFARLFGGDGNGGDTSAPKPGEYGEIRANGVQMKPEDSSGMGERGGVESALLNIQRDTGIESDYDGTWGGGLKNALYATGHAGAGRAFAGAMNKNLQFLAKGTDADGVPLEQLPDNEVDYLMDSAGANGAGGWFRRFLGAGASGAWRGEDNIMRRWDETDGAKIEDPAERKRARIEYAREIARGMIGQTETSKQRAAAELEGREETTAGAALRGLIEQGGYTLPFIAGSMLGGTPGSFLLAGGLEGADRYNELRADKLAMDADGNIDVEAAGDEVSDAAGKALLRGIMSPTIEMVGGKAASALGGKLLGATIGKVPLFRKAGNALAATKAGRAVDAFAKRLNFLGRYTGMQGMPEEMAEELEDQVLDAAFGIDRRESEKREGETWTDRAGESFSDFFKGENLKELATSMLLMQVIGGGVGGYAMDRIRSRHIDGVLREVAGVDASELKYYTADEKMDAFKAWADGLTEDEIADKFNKGAKQVNRMVSEIRRNVGENQFAETDADAPKFNAPMRTNGDGQTLADENGNPIPDFQEVTDDAGRPVMRLYDAESGVTIDRIDMGDGDSQFRVTDAAGRVRAAETYQQAVERANQMLSGEYLSGAKRQYLESLTRPGRMLSGMDIVAGDSLRDVVDEIGERYGEEAAESVRRRIGNPDEDTSGQSFRYVLPDGRSGVAFVLGKIGSVEEMATAAMHEAGRHAGLDMLFDTPQKKADFLKKIDGKGIDTGAAARAMTPEQRRSFEGELKDIQQRYGLASRDDVFNTPEAVEELFAYFTENEFGNASLKDRFVAGLRSLYRDMFDTDLSYNDADLLAMAGELNRRMRGNTEAGRMTYRSAQTRLGREEAGDIENRRQGRRVMREQERQRANAPAQIPYNPTAPEGTTVPRLGYDPAQTSYGPIVTPQTQAESWRYDERPGQAWGDIVRNGPNLLQQMRNGQRGRQAAENGPRSAGTETGATASQNGADGAEGGKTAENGGKPQDLSDLIQETEEFPLNPRNSSNREFPVGTIVKRSDGSTYIRVDGELEDIASGEKEPKWQEYGVVGRPGRYAVQSHVIGGTSTPERGGAKIITTPPRTEATPPNGADSAEGGISRQNGAQATNGRVNSEQMRRIKSKNRILTDKEVESSTGKEPDVMDEKAWDAWYEKAVVVKDRHVAEHDMGNWNTVEVSRAGRDKDGNPTYEAYVVNGVESPVYTMGGVEGDKMPFFVNWLGVDPNDTRIESLATEFMAKRGRPNGMTSLDNRKGRQPRNRKDGHAWDIDEAGPQFENFKDAHDFGNLPEVKRIIEEFGNESESERKNTNETGNGTAEAPAQPEQGAAGTAGTETAGQVAGTAQGTEAQTSGVVRPRTRRGQNLRGYSYEDYAAHPDDGGTGDEIGASILRFARDNGGLLRMPPKGAADPFSDWIAGFLDGNAKKNRRGDYIALFGMRPRTGTNDALTENMPSDLQAYVENMIEREGPEAVVNWFLETRRKYAEWAANKRNAAREEKAVSRERDEEAAAYTDEELARRASERDAASEAEAEEDAAIERQEEEWDRAEREAIEAEAREADEQARREQAAPNARERLASVYAEWADGEALPAWADRLTDAEAKEYADLIDAALNVEGDDGGKAYRAVTDFEKRHEAASPAQTRETAPASVHVETQTADGSDTVGNETQKRYRVNSQTFTEIEESQPFTDANLSTAARMFEGASEKTIADSIEIAKKRAKTDGTAKLLYLPRSYTRRRVSFQIEDVRKSSPIDWGNGRLLSGETVPVLLVKPNGNVSFVKIAERHFDRVSEIAEQNGFEFGLEGYSREIGGKDFELVANRENGRAELSYTDGEDADGFPVRKRISTDKEDANAAIKDLIAKAENVAKQATSSTDARSVSAQSAAAQSPATFKRGYTVMLRNSDGQYGAVTFVKDNGDGTATVQRRTANRVPYLPAKVENLTVRMGDLAASGMKRTLTEAEREAERRGRAEDKANGMDVGEANVRWRRGDSKLDNLRRLMSGKGSAEVRWRRAIPELQKAGMYGGDMRKHMEQMRKQTFPDGTDEKEGAESIVIRTGDRVVKYRYARDLSGRVFDKIQWHNELFGDKTPYEVREVVADDDWNDRPPRIVLEQPYVEIREGGGAEARRRLVEDLRRRFGAENVTVKGDPASERMEIDAGPYHISDLKDLNVGIDERTGDYAVWDANIEKRKGADAGGEADVRWRRTYTPNPTARTAADNGTMTQREQDEVNSIMPPGGRGSTSRDRQERAAREQASRDAFARAFHNAGTWQRVGMLLDKNTRRDAWRAVKESVIRKMQDAGLDLRKYEVRRFERQFGKPVSRWTNAEKEQFVSQSTYYAMDRAYGRKENLSLKLNQNYVRPLEKQIAENGLDEAWTDERGEQNISADGKPLSKLDVYLMALHGGEYNRMIAERTARAEGGPVLDGSGRSTEYWERQLARFRNEGFDRKAAEAVRLVHEMNKAALQQMVDSGRISQKQADKWNELSPNYVPLRNSDAAHDLFEQLLFGGDIDEQTYRKAFSGTEYNHAAGRRSLADSPVINSIQQAEWAIARSMDNESRRSLAAQVRADPRMGTVVMQMSKTDFDEAQRQIAVFTQMEADGTITPAQRDRLARLKQNVADTIAGNRLLPRRRMLNQNSEVQSVIDVQGLEDDPNVGWVAFKENGDTKYIKLGHHELVDANGNATGNMDELTGNRIAKFVNGQSFVKLGGVMRFVRNLSRGFGMLRTSLSPTFLFSNFLADNGQALRNVFHTLGAGAMRTFEGHAMDMGKNGARASALRYLRGQLDPQRYAIDRFTKEWAEAGGQIGGFATESFGDIDERMAASLRRMQRRLSRGKGGWADALKDGARALGERFKELNSAIEMATRISAYATMRENGMGVNDAVSYARDVTVNFNRKGEWTPIFNALYVFSNANIQDMQRTGMTFTGSRAAKLNGTLFVLGLLSAALGFGQDEPDDEAEGKETWENASEHRKQNGISFRVGGKVISLPLRGLARMPYYAGHKAFEALTGRRDAKDVAADIGSFMFSAAAEPLSTTSSLAQSVAPSILRPAVELIENKSFTGAPIHRTKMSETQVASEMGRQSTSGMAVWLARTLNSLTGGNRNRSGMIDVFPETLEQIGRGLAGTLGTDLMKGVTLAKDIATFHTPATRDVPFVSRVASDMEKNSRRYHEAVTDFERDQKEYKDLAQEDPSVMAALRRNSPWFREGNEMWYNELDSLRKLNKKLMVEETKADGNEREALNELRMKTQGLFLWRLKHAPESDAPAKRAEYGQRNRLIDRMLRGRAAARKQEERNGRK